MSSNPDTKLYSETEAAERLGISRPTLLRLRKESRIGCYRIGARVLYSEVEHIRPFLDGCNRPPGAAGDEQAPANPRVLSESED